MNNIINLTISGQPIAKQRSRKGKYDNWYNPQSDIMFQIEKEIKKQLPDGWEKINSDVPVTVNMSWFISPAKTKATKKFIDFIKNEDIIHTQKPDRDNLDKFYLDCMSGIVFHDDCQCGAGELIKIWSVNPRTEIEVIF